MLIAHRFNDRGLVVPQTTLTLESVLSDSAPVTLPNPRGTVDPPQQAVAADMHARYVVWQESPTLELMVEPWRLHAFDRRTSSAAELTRAGTVEGLEPPPAPGFTGPVLIGSHVFWADVGGRPGSETVDIKGCAVADCRVETYLPASAFPATDGRDLYAIRADRYAGARSSPTMTVQRLDLASEEIHDIETVPLTESETPGGLAASRRALTWSVAGPGHVATG